MKPDQSPQNLLEQKHVKVIETPRQLLIRLNDAQNQFLQIQFDLKKGLSIEQLKENNELYNKEGAYVSFNEYLKKINCELSSEVKNDENCTLLINVHDDLIERVKNFQTIEELRQILADATEFLAIDASIIEQEELNNKNPESLL